MCIDSVDEVQPEIRKYVRRGDTEGLVRAIEIAYEFPEKAPVSHLQRNLKIGYNRAAEYMDLLRERGVIKD